MDVQNINADFSDLLKLQNTFDAIRMSNIENEENFISGP